MTRAQGKHREFSLNQSVATLQGDTPILPNRGYPLPRSGWRPVTPILSQDGGYPPGLDWMGVPPPLCLDWMGVPPGWG